MVFLLSQSYIVKPFATIPKGLPQPCWHWLTGGIFDSATGGTFHSDTPGTFESDMDGTFKVLQSGQLIEYALEADTYAAAEDNPSSALGTLETNALIIVRIIPPITQKYK